MILASLSVASTSLSAHGQTTPSKSERKQAFWRDREEKAKNQIEVSPDKDWKGWLKKNFPDASASWTEAAAKAFPAAAGAEKWDFVGKGNIDRDGAPTGLLIRLEPEPKDDNSIVSRLVVVKWMDGAWKELLSADAAKGIAVNGVKPGAMQSPKFHGYQLSLFAGDKDDRENPGMWITLEAVDDKGETLTEPANFYYAPQTRRYGGSAY